MKLFRFRNVLAILLLIPTLSFAGKVKVSHKGVVTVDGKAVFKIDTKLGTMSSSSSSLSVYNLEGKKLIDGAGNPGSDYITIFFLKTHQKMKYLLTIGFKKRVAKNLVQMNVIKDGELNPEGVKKFMVAYKYNAQEAAAMYNNINNYMKSGTSVSETTNARPTLVTRNTNATIFINGNEISQDFKEIGQLSTHNEESGGNLINFYTVSDVDGFNIATVSNVFGSKKIQIRTYDNRQFNIYLASSSDELAIEKFIVKNLISRGLL